MPILRMRNEKLPISVGAVRAVYMYMYGVHFLDSCGGYVCCGFSVTKIVSSLPSGPSLFNKKNISSLVDCLFTDQGELTDKILKLITSNHGRIPVYYSP